MHPEYRPNKHKQAASNILFRYMTLSIWTSCIIIAFFAVALALVNNSTGVERWMVNQSDIEFNAKRFPYQYRQMYGDGREPEYSLWAQIWFGSNNKGIHGYAFRNQQLSEISKVNRDLFSQPHPVYNSHKVPQSVKDNLPIVVDYYSLLQFASILSETVYQSEIRLLDDESYNAQLAQWQLHTTQFWVFQLYLVYLDDVDQEKLPEITELEQLSQKMGTDDWYEEFLVHLDLHFPGWF